MELSSPRIKKFLIFSQNKFFLYFEKRNFLTLRLKNFLYFSDPALKNKFFLYFGEWNFLIFSQVFFVFREMELFDPKSKSLLIFSQKKVFLIFQEMELSSPKIKKYSGKNFPSLKNKTNPL